MWFYSNYQISSIDAQKHHTGLAVTGKVSLKISLFIWISVLLKWKGKALSWDQTHKNAFLVNDIVHESQCVKCRKNWMSSCLTLNILFQLIAWHVLISCISDVNYKECQVTINSFCSFRSAEKIQQMFGEKNPGKRFALVSSTVHWPLLHCRYKSKSFCFLNYSLQSSNEKI